MSNTKNPVEIAEEHATMKTLLEECLYAFNMMPRQKVNGRYSSYDLASKLSKFLGDPKGKAPEATPEPTPEAVNAGININTCNGKILIDDTGKIIFLEDETEEGSLKSILRFDVKEFKKHYDYRLLIGHIDILDIGYWYTGKDRKEHYEPAEPSYRAMVDENKKDNA